MTDVLKTLEKLPEICASRLPSDNSPIMLKRGVVGYWPAPPALDPDDYNARHGITPDQVEAMAAGSIFGWDCPGADPDTWAAERKKHKPAPWAPRRT